MFIRLILACALLVAAISLHAQGNVGVGTTTPTQRLHVNGKVKVGDDAASPSAGTIRWNTTKSDFEGYNGTEWLSLTASNRTATIGSSNEAGQLVDYNSGSAPVLEDNAYYGECVDISGDWAVVGARLEGQGGAAHVFRRSGTNWNYFQKLTSADIGNKDQFGTSVAIDGNFIIIGAPYDSLNAVEYNGSAYIFFFNGTNWIQEQKIYNPHTSQVRAFFGESVDISGDMAIIGASQHDDGPNADEGLAICFKRNTGGPSWNQNGVFFAPSGMAGAYFGASVSIYGSYIAISSPFYDLPTGLGAVFIFFFNGTSWSMQQRLTANDPGNDQFGYHISLDNATVVVGARSAFEEYSGQGTAYVFFRTGLTWSQQAKLLIPKTHTFGNSVGISGNILIIGAPDTRRYDPCGTVATGAFGKAFVYKRTGVAWERFLTIDLPGGNDGDQFGYSVAIDGSYISVSAPGADVNGVDKSGRVIFGRLE